ncbi:MAG: IS1634 family transposase [Thermoplasmata archaeon]
MPGIVWKSIHGKRYLVLRWKKWENGQSRVTKEIYIGDAERLSRILEDPGYDVTVTALSYGSTSSILEMEKTLGVKGIVDGIVGHRGKGMSPGDYVLLFAMNRLSDPRSKNGIGEWMKGDYASTIYPKASSQGYWNIMDRFTTDHIRMIKERIRERLISMGYDHSRMFVDGSNFYTYMKENDMVRKGHNKAHRYDLNQMSYYIEANEDYIPFYGDSHPGNMHDSRTFRAMVDAVPESSILIFDRGYNSRENIQYIRKRKYIGALLLSDHRDLAAIPVEKDSSVETGKVVYGIDHRIIIYHSSKLERKRIIAFMKMFRKAYGKVRSTVESGDSDSMDRARMYLESMHLQETILLPGVSIDRNRLHSRLEMLGKTALFTSIPDLPGEEIIDLYRRRNRVEHCFRTISMHDLMSPEYHWTPQKIKVHMLFSHIAYLFLALIYNRISDITSLASSIDVLKTIRITFLVRNSNVRKVVTSQDDRGIKAMKILGIESVN